jgi:prepilin-type N-terminal cleavage/methylation domain-containing protein
MKMNKKFSAVQKGFTIIELIVVVIIMVVLAGIVVANVISYVKKDKDFAVKENMNTILKNSFTYITVNNNYSNFSSDKGYTVPAAAILSQDNGKVAPIFNGNAINFCLSAPTFNSGIYCVDTKGFAYTGSCSAVGLCSGTIADGGVCSVAQDCISIFCNSMGTCGKVADGNTCSGNNADCLKGHCNTGNYTCGIASEGGVCYDNTDCANNFPCYNGTCDYAPNGTSCSQDNPQICSNGFCNSTNRCGLNDIGDPCNSGSDCAGGICNLNGRCGLVKTGGYCTQDTDCDEYTMGGGCVNNVCVDNKN